MSIYKNVVPIFIYISFDKSCIIYALLCVKSVVFAVQYWQIAEEIKYTYSYNNMCVNVSLLTQQSYH